MATEIYAYLFVTGDCVPFDEVTATLGVPPDRTERKGELPGPNVLKPYEYDSWELVTERREGFDLDEDVGRLLHRIEGREAALRELAQRHGLYVGVTCVGYIEETMPTLHFDAPLLSRLSSIGAALDIDLYDHR